MYLLDAVPLPLIKIIGEEKAKKILSEVDEKLKPHVEYLLKNLEVKLGASPWALVLRDYDYDTKILRREIEQTDFRLAISESGYQWKHGLSREDVRLISFKLYKALEEALANLKPVFDFEKIAEAKLKVSWKEELIEYIAVNVLSNYTIITLHGDILCYCNGVYRECEEKIRAYIESFALKEDLSKKVSRYVVNEVLDKIRRRTYREPEKVEWGRFYLAFENGLLDLKEFLATGVITVKPFNPSIYAFHRIPHRLRTLGELLGEKSSLENLEPYIKDWISLGEILCPRIHKAFIEWVGEDYAKLQYEKIGYCFYPDMPLHIAFMEVGDGSNGKSTFLKLVKLTLGSENVVSIPLQDLLENRFMKAKLYHKLANIYADLPEAPLKNTGVFKILTGGDPITADRKFRDPITFVNYAKLIFSANQLPRVNDMSYAFWRRWIVTEYPNKFPYNPGFLKELIPEIEGLIVVSLYALRDLLERKAFSIPEEKDYKEFWLRRSNSVYAFVKDMVEVTKDPNDYVLKSELYSKYVEYCEENDLEAFSKVKFAIELQRLVPVKSGLKGSRRERAWVGIRLKEEPETREEGLEPYVSQE